MGSANKPTRPVMRYHSPGGKWMLAPWIVQHFPAHRIYVEPFAGAASVLMRKPATYHEVLNDLCGEVVNVFRVLRDAKDSARLLNALRLTPFARDEFDLSYVDADDPVEQARRTIFRSFAGFGSAAVNAKHRTGFRSHSRRSRTSPSEDWRNYPGSVAAFVDRLRGVTIENRPAVDVIRAQDAPDALLYVDPPYPHDTRSMERSNAAYVHEMDDDGHRELAEVLRNAAGMVVLSGYPCALYDEDLYPDWHRVERESLADGARKRTEVLWMNAACVAATRGVLPFGGPA